MDAYGEATAKAALAKKEAELAGKALAAMADGDTLRTMLAALRRLMKVTPINTVAPRRRIADETVARGGYVFGM